MPPLIRRIHIRHYKSISNATVDLDPLTIFVGPNGAGKSNFLDALTFVRDSVVQSVDLAFKNRGGISAVRRRSGGHPTNLGLRLEIELSPECVADYSFQIAAKSNERFRVSRERCIVSQLMGDVYRYEVRNGEFTEDIPGIRPRLAEDRLALFAASNTEEFRPVYDFLSGIHRYSIVPFQLREWQDPDAGEVLTADGSNAAAVLKRIQDVSLGRYERICRLLAAAVPGLESVGHKTVGRRETIDFRQNVGQKHPWQFDAHNISDGTLRMLGLLLAIYQVNGSKVLGIEEPEASVHPALAGQILEILRDASNERQILVTTHSPELLDFPHVAERGLKVVVSEDNSTIIAPLSARSKSVVRDQLLTPGELMRLGELAPDSDEAKMKAEQFRLFGAPGTLET